MLLLVILHVTHIYMKEEQYHRRLMKDFEIMSSQQSATQLI